MVTLYIPKVHLSSAKTHFWKIFLEGESNVLYTFQGGL